MFREGMGAIFLAALRHPFAGGDSVKKLVVGSLLNLIPGVNLLALGYALRLMREVLAGEETELPPWEGWGGLWLDGVRVLVVGVASMLDASAAFACRQSAI